MGDIQQVCADIMVKTNPRLGTLHETVQTLKLLDAANNKLRMIDWLKDDLGIDYESLSMRSFVHMKHDLYALRFTLSFVSVWIAFQRFCLLLCGLGTSEIRNLVNMARCVANVRNVSLRRQPV